MNKLRLLLVILAVVVTGCIVVPEGGYYRGYQERPHRYYDHHNYDHQYDYYRR